MRARPRSVRDSRSVLYRQREGRLPAASASSKTRTPSTRNSCLSRRAFAVASARNALTDGLEVLSIITVPLQNKRDYLIDRADSALLGRYSAMFNSTWVNP